MPKASRLMPLPELVWSPRRRRLDCRCRWRRPPVADTFEVPAAATVTLPALFRRKADGPEVVVRLRSVPNRSPKVVEPVVLDMLIAPDPEPVTAISSNTLVPMLVALSAFAPAVVIEIVPADAKFTVPALLRSTPTEPDVWPVAVLLLMTRLEMLKVPVVPSSSREAWVPAVPGALAMPHIADSAAVISGAAGNAVGGALRIDGQTDGIAVRSEHHAVDHESLAAADQLLAGLEHDARGVVVPRP